MLLLFHTLFDISQCHGHGTHGKENVAAFCAFVYHFRFQSVQRLSTLALKIEGKHSNSERKKKLTNANKNTSFLLFQGNCVKMSIRNITNSWKMQ